MVNLLLKDATRSEDFLNWARNMLPQKFVRQKLKILSTFLLTSSKMNAKSISPCKCISWNMVTNYIFSNFDKYDKREKQWKNLRNENVFFFYSFAGEWKAFQESVAEENGSSIILRIRCQSYIHFVSQVWCNQIKFYKI